MQLEWYHKYLISATTRTWTILWAILCLPEFTTAPVYSQVCLFPVFERSSCWEAAIILVYARLSILFHIRWGRKLDSVKRKWSFIQTPLHKRWRWQDHWSPYICEINSPANSLLRASNQRGKSVISMCNAKDSGWKIICNLGDSGQDADKGRPPSQLELRERFKSVTMKYKTYQWQKNSVTNIANSTCIQCASEGCSATNQNLVRSRPE